jgi:HAD superfamily phosphoserine phosphatase-like hydrolase
MNVYDFDDTIYDGDTNRDLLKYSFKKHPLLVIKSLIKTIIPFIKYKMKKVPFERVKEVMLSFLFEIDTEKYIKEFVREHMKNIKPWYKERHTKNDVLLSASYYLWISEFGKELGIKTCIATNTDKNGKIIGKNCKKQEKVNRLKEVISLDKVETAYGDSSCDVYVLNIAKKGYVVEGNELVPYKKGYKFKTSR